MADSARPAVAAEDTGWSRFWAGGGWWKAVLVAVGYIAIYLGLGWAVGSLAEGMVDPDDPLSSPLSVFVGLALPILIMGALTLVFIQSLGWRREIFGRQPVEGRPWMWLAVILVLIPNVMRLVATDWSAYSVALVLSVLFLGLCVGFSEELLTRGVAVAMLRRGGYTERLVMVLSSVIFAALHATNVFSGQAPATVAFTVVYTFGFGAMMYLSMRVTGSLVWAMLLHASTDPSAVLATGGIDAHGDTSGAEGLIAAAGVFNYVYVLAALVAIFLVRGKVSPNRTAPSRRVSNSISGK